MRSALAGLRNRALPAVPPSGKRVCGCAARLQLAGLAIVDHRRQRESAELESSPNSGSGPPPAPRPAGAEGAK